MSCVPLWAPPRCKTHHYLVRRCRINGGAPVAGSFRQAVAGLPNGLACLLRQVGSLPGLQEGRTESLWTLWTKPSGWTIRCLGGQAAWPGPGLAAPLSCIHQQVPTMGKPGGVLPG